MSSRQSVRVTYAHKKRRVPQGKRLFSSPLDVLPPDKDDLTHTQMARRMLKRSRRVALDEQVEDKNVEHIREHLAKRIKSTQARVFNLEPSERRTTQHDLSFQTPFPSSQSVHDSLVAKPLAPEQLSPVPTAKRVLSRTSSRNLKENDTHSQVLASPFNSRPGSAASSPQRKSRERSSRRTSRISFHAKSRTLSGAFKENTRRVSRKDSTASLKDADGEPPPRHLKHRRYPSSPSTAYMRFPLVQEDVTAAPKASSRTFGGHMSPGGSICSDASFYADRPQSCSTPARLRVRKLPDLRGCQTAADNALGLGLHDDIAQACGPDVEMTDSVAPPRHQTIHLSGNSIFSSSGEFTIRSLAASNEGATSISKTSRDGLQPRVHQVLTRPRVVNESQAGHSLAGSFIAEFDVPLADIESMDHLAASISVTKTFGPDGAPKLSVGELNFPGTSPAHGASLFIRSRKPAVAKSSVAEQPFGLPGTSPTHGECLIVRTSRNPGTLTPPASPPKSAAPCPPASPTVDLAQELELMDLRGGTHTQRERRRSFTSIPLQPRSPCVPAASAATKPTAKSMKRRPARSRAGTIRASDFAKPAGGSTVASASDVRRTRSGTVIGPTSKLAAKSTGLPAQAVKGASTTRLATVQSGSDSESDDELLLKRPWVEDVEYLGRKAHPGGDDAEADELNLGGLWHGLEFAPQPSPRRSRLRK